MRRFFYALAIASVMLLCAGCAKRQEAFLSTDITGIDYAHGFTLNDHHGMPRTLAGFKGKVVVVFFGYTQCPDVCPTTMADLAGAMKELGPLSERVQVLFITLDPQRDTAELLAQYVPAFDPRFIGLTGDEAAIDKTAKEFHIFYQKVPGKQPENYTLDHSAGTYVFDPEGRARLFMHYGESAKDIAHDLRILLG